MGYHCVPRLPEQVITSHNASRSLLQDRCIRRPASWGRRAGRSGRAPCALLQRDAGSIRLRCVAFAAPSRSTASDRTHSTSLSASGSRGARRVSCAAASGSGDWSGQKPPSRGGTNEREMEKSPLIYEELMYFIFQLDLDTQLQRSLNYEAYEMAKEIREKRQAVDDAVARMARVKGKNAGGPSAGAGGGGSAGGQLTAADFASEGLRLRTEMQRAVEQERCGAVPEGRGKRLACYARNDHAPYPACISCAAFC